MSTPPRRGNPSPLAPSVLFGPLPQPGRAPTQAHGTRCGRAGSAPQAPLGRAAARAAAAAATAAAAAAAVPWLLGAAPARPPGALRPPCGRGHGCGRSESGRKRSARPGGGRQEGRRAGQEIPHRLPDPGPAAAGQAAAPAPCARPHPPAAPPPLYAAPAPTLPLSNLGRTWKGPEERRGRVEPQGLAGGVPSPSVFSFPPQTPIFWRSRLCELTMQPDPGRKGGRGTRARRTESPTLPPGTRKWPGRVSRRLPWSRPQSCLCCTPPSAPHSLNPCSAKLGGQLFLSTQCKACSERNRNRMLRNRMLEACGYTRSSPEARADHPGRDGLERCQGGGMAQS